MVLFVISLNNAIVLAYNFQEFKNINTADD